MYLSYDNRGRIEDLKGLVLASITGAEKDSAQVVFTTADGTKYLMEHYQDCCESVYVEDVIGDVSDLIGEEIIVAEESTSTDKPAGSEPKYRDDTELWTFYRLATRKGWVAIRWYGSSNGYYGIGVNFGKYTEQ